MCIVRKLTCGQRAESVVLNIMVHIPTTSVYRSVDRKRQDESVYTGFSRLLIRSDSRFARTRVQTLDRVKKEMSWPDI